MFGLKKKQKKDIDDKAAVDGPKARSPLGDISKMLNASGRIALPTLEKLVKVYQKTKFKIFMEQPVLVGSSIQSGSLNLRKRASKEEMNRTVVFELDPMPKTPLHLQKRSSMQFTRWSRANMPAGR